MKPDLKQFTTEELARELASRPEVESGNTGLYQKFEVKRKYSNDRSKITDAAVLIVHHLVL